MFPPQELASLFHFLSMNGLAFLEFRDHNRASRNVCLHTDVVCVSGLRLTLHV